MTYFRFFGLQQLGDLESLPGGLHTHMYYGTQSLTSYLDTIGLLKLWAGKMGVLEITVTVFATKLAPRMHQF